MQAVTVAGIPPMPACPAQGPHRIDAAGTRAAR